MKKPKIRFPEFTETYIEYRLGDIYQERKEGGNIDLPMLSVSIHSGISNGELDENELGKRVKRSEDKSLYKRVCQGDLVFNMMRAWQGAIGTAKIDGMVTEEDVKRFAEGIDIGAEEEEMTRPAKLDIMKSAEESEIRLTIHEGKFHQVKRMFLAVGKEVTYLKRERMGTLCLDENLKPGEYRLLTEEEIENVRK